MKRAETTRAPLRCRAQSWWVGFLLVYYKRHVIVVLRDKVLTAEVTEQATHAVLPTKVSASYEEGLDMVVERAKALVDIYTAPPLW